MAFVSFHKDRSKWYAFIYANGKKQYLGAFSRKEDAEKSARCAEENRYLYERAQKMDSSSVKDSTEIQKEVYNILVNNPSYQFMHQTKLATLLRNKHKIKNAESVLLSGIDKLWFRLVYNVGYVYKINPSAFAKVEDTQIDTKAITNTEVQKNILEPDMDITNVEDNGADSDMFTGLFGTVKKLRDSLLGNRERISSLESVNTALVKELETTCKENEHLKDKIKDLESIDQLATVRAVRVCYSSTGLKYWSIDVTPLDFEIEDILGKSVDISVR